MRISFSLPNAAALSAVIALPFGAAQAEEALQPGAPSASFEMCRYDASGVGCTHFQGYVYVRRAAAPPSADGRATPATDTSLGGGRIYLRVDELR